MKQSTFLSYIAALAAALLLLAMGSAQAADSPRVTRDLQALYTFDDAGDIVEDRSGVGQPLHLKIDKMSAVQRRSGVLVVRSAVRIRSTSPAKKIIDAVKRSGGLTIEAWVKPANNKQAGPARIVSLSADANQRNFTLAQDGPRFDVRLRTTSTSANGIPSTATPRGEAKTSLTHVVYTRDAAGNVRLYINGKRRASKKVAGRLAGWNNKFHLILANEMTGDRPWLGELHLAAVYGRSLSGKEVRRNFTAGGKLSPPIVAAVKPSGLPRVGGGLQALYTFDAGGGNVVHDRSGAGQPLDLKIEKPSAVVWRSGALVIRSATSIRSSQPAKKIIDAAKRASATTIEAWVRPANTKQAGPARIVTLSADTGQRNFTLGQEGQQYDVRLRASSTSTNGIPSTTTPSGAATTALTHVVYTRDAAGNARLYINGKRRTSKKIAGRLSNWNTGFRLVLANELTGDRPWLGELHLAAIYSKALTDKEVEQNFRAGPKQNGVGHAAPEQLARAEHENNFRLHIAPLLARSCLDCHDSSSKKGGLDLSRKAAALAGGENGKVIVPGKSAESRLWELVEAGEMPPEGDPLSTADKKLLKQWVDNGAVWSGDVIDPAIYAHDNHAAAIWVQRLTVPEYIQTVRSAVGVDIEKEARRILPPDLRADGFSNTAYNLNVDLKHVEAYSRLAEIIVGRMDVLKFARRFSRSRSLSTDATMRKFVEAMGKWLLRGPLDEREITNYSGIATTVASAGGDYKEAVSLIIDAMLQSPRFIYRIEDQSGGAAGPYELASRMSYIIWGGPPDETLMRAADSGALYDKSQVESQARRMLADPRAIKRSCQFITQWLNLDRLDNLQPDSKRFSNWNAALAADMRQETLEFFKDIVWKQNRPLADLLNAQVVYATPRLAKYYGLTPQGSGLARYDVSKTLERGGLLTQGSLLTIGGDDASMVTRGLFVLKDVLRGMVKDPPPGLDTTPVPSKPGLSQRMIAEKRIANASCGGCHGKFEPLAFGLEKFDGLGAFREQDEHGNKLRDDGQILFPGAAKPAKFRSSAELMDLLAASDRVRQSITWKLTQFALGRPLGAADARSIERIHQAAWKNGGTYASLITAIVTSDLVMMTRSAQTPTKTKP